MFCEEHCLTSRKNLSDKQIFFNVANITFLYEEKCKEQDGRLSSNVAISLAVLKKKTIASQHLKFLKLNNKLHYIITNL